MRASGALLALALLGGCGDEDAEPTPARSRVAAVAARPVDVAGRFCDVAAPEGQGPLLTMPDLEGLPAVAPGWRWVNVWATWCTPCVEEMPRIVTWSEQLTAAGTPVTPVFVSVDESAEVVASFRQAHPGLPASARLTEMGALSRLFASFGLDSATSIPIHALVDPSGRVRCARAGAVTERDFESVRGIVTGR